MVDTHFYNTVAYNEVLDILLTQGADPNHVGMNNRIPPVVLAANHGYYKLIKKFFKQNVQVDLSANDKEKKIYFKKP